MKENPRGQKKPVYKNGLIHAKYKHTEYLQMTASWVSCIVFEEASHL